MPPRPTIAPNWESSVPALSRSATLANNSTTGSLGSRGFVKGSIRLSSASRRILPRTRFVKGSIRLSSASRRILPRTREERARTARSCGAVVTDLIADFFGCSIEYTPCLGEIAVSRAEVAPSGAWPHLFHACHGRRSRAGVAAAMRGGSGPAVAGEVVRRGILVMLLRMNPVHEEAHPASLRPQ